jgi:hypothetical protein
MENISYSKISVYGWIVNITKINTTYICQPNVIDDWIKIKIMIICLVEEHLML